MPVGGLDRVSTRDLFLVSRRRPFLTTQTLDAQPDGRERAAPGLWQRHGAGRRCAGNEQPPAGADGNIIATAVPVSPPITANDSPGLRIAFVVALFLGGLLLLGLC